MSRDAQTPPRYRHLVMQPLTFSRDDEGEWVKASDVDALQTAHQKELEGYVDLQAAHRAEQRDAFIAVDAIELGEGLENSGDLATRIRRIGASLRPERDTLRAEVEALTAERDCLRADAECPLCDQMPELKGKLEAVEQQRDEVNEVLKRETHRDAVLIRKLEQQRDAIVTALRQRIQDWKTIHEVNFPDSDWTRLRCAESIEKLLEEAALRPAEEGTP